MSPAAVDRPADRADAAVHQGPTTTQQHPSTHRRPARQAAPRRLSRGARKVAQ